MNTRHALSWFLVLACGHVQAETKLPYTPVVTPNEVVLAYEGLDSIVRQTVIDFSIPAHKITAERAIFELKLQGQEQWRLESKVSCRCVFQRMSIGSAGASNFGCAWSCSLMRFSFTQSVVTSVSGWV